MDSGQVAAKPATLPRATESWGARSGTHPSDFPGRASCPPSSSEQPCFGEMLGTHSRIRELLLCFPFGFYPYVRDSPGRRAGRQGGEL